MDSNEDSMNGMEHNNEVEEFTNYLEQNNVVDQFTNVLIMLYSESERPSDPIEYVRKNLCPDNSDVRDIAELECLLESARAELAEHLRVRNVLVAKLEQLENNGESFEDEEVGTLQDFHVQGHCAGAE